MLGLCASYLLARAVAEFYQIQGWQAKLCCDNKQALELSSYKQGWIRLSSKCADIRRNIQLTKQTFQGTFRYIHVYGHMNKYLAWNQLNLMQQMNCVCNMLAKKAVAIALLKGYHNRTTQLLPNEGIALVIWGNKVTGDIAPVLRFHASKEAARKYLASQKRNPWPSERFNKVDWEHLNLALQFKADNYKIWQSKQTSGFCGTQVQVGLYSSEMYLDKQCPNCGARETDAHLMQCPNKDRSRLLIKNVAELEKLMETDGRTDPELIY
jgi:hypothetical protein